MAKRSPPIVLALAASLACALSCVSSSHASEEESIRSGAALFSENRIAEAEKAWSGIPDPVKREAYLSFARAYEELDATVSEAEKDLAQARAEEAVSAVKLSPALPPVPAGVGSPDPRSLRARMEKLGEGAGKILAVEAVEQEKAADKSLASARSAKVKEGATRAAEAAGGYSTAHRLYLAASDWVPATAEGAARTETKAQDAENLHKSLLKESLLSFPNRMGEVFARAPSPSARIDDKTLLAFAAETASMISGGISDFETTVAKYPELLDQATIDRLRASAKGLSARFARIESAIKAVKNRGKPVMPIIIGIFNPEPDDPQRSRPASFAGSSAAGPEWWWGIADIPKGVAQDLVVTMSDARPVRIYAAGLGPDGRKPTSDLVNPFFKVGNSWPVLNAGERLNDGVFHIEIGPGRNEQYSGVAVVYKSFMMRTR
jgi:hypothetical protein